MYLNSYKKLKKSYLEIKKTQLGGNNECDFSLKKFRQIGKGLQTSGPGLGVFLNSENNLVYKVMKIIPEYKPKGAWATRLMNGGFGLTPVLFNETCNKYKQASQFNLGPKFISCYICDGKGVIVTEHINGLVVTEVKKQPRWNNSYDQQLEKLIAELKRRTILTGDIIGDIHDDNFMVDNSGKIYAIDF